MRLYLAGLIDYRSIIVGDRRICGLIWEQSTAISRLHQQHRSWSEHLVRLKICSIIFPIQSQLSAGAGGDVFSYAARGRSTLRVGYSFPGEVQLLRFLEERSLNFMGHLNTVSKHQRCRQFFHCWSCRFLFSLPVKITSAMQYKSKQCDSCQAVKHDLGETKLWSAENCSH